MRSLDATAIRQRRDCGHRSNMICGVVTIGRNEGERLKRCLASHPAGAVLIYVEFRIDGRLDSGSS